MHLKLTDATKRFGPMTVFEHLDAAFPDSTVTALVGPSGSGKTTILSILAGFTPLDAGTAEMVTDDDEHIAVNPADVVWIPQGANALGRRSVLDNAMIGALAAGQDVSGATDAALGALDAVGLSTHAHKLARDLSGGELQRLAIARALASGRRIIFADEPTANLDRVNTDQVAEAIAVPHPGRLVILATHDPVLIDKAQRVVDLRPHHDH